MPRIKPFTNSLIYRALLALAWAFSSGAALAQNVIQAEDFNFDGGQFIDNPGASAFAGKGGTALVDFHENTPASRLANDTYRPPSAASPALPQTTTTEDASGQFDLALDAGEWVNYTRTFAAGAYLVTARVKDIGQDRPAVMKLEIVTADASKPDQTTDSHGVLLGRLTTNGEYSALPMTDILGTPVTIDLNGLTTLRLVSQDGQALINDLTFTPTSQRVPMPSGHISVPADNSGIDPGGDVEVTVEVDDPANVVAVQMLGLTFDGSDVEIGTIEGAGPYTFTWSGVNEGSYRLFAGIAGSNGLLGLTPTATVFADGTAPTVIQARGRTTEDVIVTFSEAMSSATAGNPANFVITAVDDGSPLEVIGTAPTDDGRVIITTAVQEVGKNYLITMNNLTDFAGNPLGDGATAEFFGNGPLLQTDLGFVVFEAEHYDRNLDGLWVEDTERGTPSGGVSMVIPNGAGGSEAETKIEYDIKFVKTGTHHFWYRASAPNGNDDSAWLHLDGERPVERALNNTASMSGFQPFDDFVWRSNAQDGGGHMTFDIATPGFHTISVARREDGAFFDKFVITTDPNFDPAAIGPFGPENTPREGEETTAGKVEITQDPDDVIGVEHDSVTLVADGTGEDGFIFLFQWQRKEGDNWVDIPGATLTSYTIDRVSLDWNGAVVRMGVTTDGAAVYSKEATITITPETESPVILGATGHDNRIALTFSEPLAEGPASNSANYQVRSDAGTLAVTAVDFLPSERAVILTTAPQTIGAKYTVTANNLTDQAATPNVIANGVRRFYSLGALLPQSEDGLLVFEAESYTNNTDELWITDSDWGIPSGGLSVVLPNGAGGNEESKVEYELEFTQTGEHIIWYRASGPSGTDDSAWLHLDGVRPPNRVDGNQASMTGFGDTSDFVWLSNPQDGGGQMTFNIDSPGMHTIGLARREDGAFFDKFVITTDPTFDPRNFGVFGPAETRAGAPAMPNVSISAPDTVAEGGNLTITPTISASDRTVAMVTYFANGLKIGESTSSPFTFTWNSPEGGNYTITAMLSDDTGEIVSAESISVFVEGGGGEFTGTGGDPKSIVWVSVIDSDAGAEFEQLFSLDQHTVTPIIMAGDPSADDLAMMNASDVVIVSRKVSSGEFNVTAWDEQISKPLILMSAYLSRASRWGWFGADGLVDATPETITAALPNHPVFAGITVTDGLSESWHTAVDRGTSLPTDPVINGGTLIASDGGNVVVAEWPAGSVAAGPRMFFGAGSREADGATIDTAGQFNLTEAGGRALLNAIQYMSGLTSTAVVDFQSVERTDAGVVIRFAAGQTYDIEYSTTLETESWQVIASDVSTQFEDTDAARVNAGVGFYRGVAK